MLIKIYDTCAVTRLLKQERHEAIYKNLVLCSLEYLNDDSNETT